MQNKDMNMSKTTSCTVSSVDQAENILRQLEAAGFLNNDISVIFPEKKEFKQWVQEKHTKAPEGATTGATAGGVVGGVVGLLAGLGSLAIPGLGPLIAAGPILAALSGAAVGATVGGITGALVGLGIPEYEAKLYEKKLKEGNILITVHTEDFEDEKRETAREIFKMAGASDISKKVDSTIKPEQVPGATDRFKSPFPTDLDRGTK